MSPVAFKVGDLARRTGLTVRTLHFYEEIGLVKPGERSEGGHRLYGPSEIARLQRITSLRQLGFTLEEIGDLLDGREGRPDAVIQRHLGQLREQIAHAEALATRLERLAKRLQASAEIEVDDLLQAIEETVMHEKYFTEAQRADIEQRRKNLGEEGRQRAWQAWTDVLVEARAEQQNGTPPGDPRAIDVAQRWSDVVEQLSGSDPALREAMKRMWRENPRAMEERTGIEPALLTWIGQSLALHGRLTATKIATLRVPGATLHYQVRGTGPLLLVLQGGAADADGWNGVTDHLVDSYSVVTYDRRGLSRSKLDDPTESTSVETHSDDAHRLLAALTGEPALVVGCSLGALIALDLVSRHPEQISTLIAHEPPVPELLPDAERALAEQGQESAEEAYRRDGWASAMKRFIEITGVSHDDREPDVMLPRPSSQAMINAEFFLRHDAPAARRYQVDIPLLKRAQTWIVPAGGSTDRPLWIHRCAAELANRLGTKMVEFPGGHAGFVTHPRGFAERLREVLASRAPS